MDEQPVPITAPLPTQPPVPVQTPAPAGQSPLGGAAPPQKSVTPPVAVYVIFTVLLILICIVGLLIMKPHSAPAVPAPTPISTLPTPTPIQQQTAVATQSAFLQFASAVSSLSAAVSANSTQDQTLNPPVLTLPLGF